MAAVAPGLTGARVAAAGPRPELLELATAAADRAISTNHVARPALLTIIDYSLPSTTERLWVINRQTGEALWSELVAHGSGTGDNLATKFSNRHGSHQTSLGLFLTADTYNGRNGYSLRLVGLDAGFNDLASERAIVVHGAPYVDAAFARQHGRIGRSWGCPAVRPAIARALIDDIKGGSLIFAYYPDAAWLSASSFLTDATTPAG